MDLNPLQWKNKVIERIQEMKTPWHRLTPEQLKRKIKLLREFELGLTTSALLLIFYNFNNFMHGKLSYFMSFLMVICLIAAYDTGSMKMQYQFFLYIKENEYYGGKPQNNIKDSPKEIETTTTLYTQ